VMADWSAHASAATPERRSTSVTYLVRLATKLCSIPVRAQSAEFTLRFLEQLFAGSIENVTSGTPVRSLDSAVCRFFGSMPGDWGSAESRSRLEDVVPKAVSQDFRNGRIRAYLQKRKGQKWQVNAMEKLIEFYEMVSLNDAALRGSEKAAIRNARRALRMFERAMKNFKTVSTEVPYDSEISLRLAA